MKGRSPDFTGSGIAVWINKDKNNEDYLSIILLNSIKLVAWKSKNINQNNLKVI